MNGYDFHSTWVAIVNRRGFGALGNCLISLCLSFTNEQNDAYIYTSFNGLISRVAMP